MSKTGNTDKFWGEYGDDIKKAAGVGGDTTKRSDGKENPPPAGADVGISGREHVGPSKGAGGSSFQERPYDGGKHYRPAHDTRAEYDPYTDDMQTGASTRNQVTSSTSRRVQQYGICTPEHSGTSLSNIRDTVLAVIFIVCMCFALPAGLLVVGFGNVVPAVESELSSYTYEAPAPVAQPTPIIGLIEVYEGTKPTEGGPGVIAGRWYEVTAVPKISIPATEQAVPIIPAPTDDYTDTTELDISKDTLVTVFLVILAALLLTLMLAKL